MLKFSFVFCGNSSGVEHNLAMVGVASSNLVSRSKPGWWNGRHKGLKIPRKFFRIGSSPISGTIKQKIAECTAMMSLACQKSVFCVFETTLTLCFAIYKAA